MLSTEINRLIELRNSGLIYSAIARQLLEEFPEQKWYPGKVGKLLEEHKELVTVESFVGSPMQSIEYVKSFVKQHGGTFINIERCYKPPRPGRPHIPRQKLEVTLGKENYVRSYDRVHYRCKEDHHCRPEWRKVKDKFLLDHKFLNDELPCAECRANHIRLKEEVYHEYAKSHGGKCLATKQFFKKPNSKEKILWKCSEGHQWLGMLESMHNQNTWCPECAIAANAKSRLKYDATTALEYATDNNLTILNKTEIEQDELFGVKSKIEFKCNKCGNESQTNLSNWLIHQHGCRPCALIRSGLNQRKYAKEDAQALAEKNGGNFIDSEVGRVDDQRWWRCKEGHEWKTSLVVIKAGSWCPVCAKKKHITEEILREVIEQRFSKFGNFRFPSSRPAWLINPNTRKRLELDCYNEDLGVAFEFHGWLHYEVSEAFGGEPAFIKRRRRDQFTRFRCAQNDVILIEIDGRKVTRIPKDERAKALSKILDEKLKNLSTAQKQKLLKTLKG